MIKDGEHIYKIKRRVKSSILKKLSSILVLAVLFLVFLFAGVVFAFGNKLFLSLPLIGKTKNFLVIFVFAFIILFCYAILIILNAFISPIRLKLSQLCTGAVCSLAVGVIGSIFFTIYLKIFNGYNAFYGSIAGIVIFLLWAYILMLGISIGPVVCMKIYYGQNTNQKSLFYNAQGGGLANKFNSIKKS